MATKSRWVFKGAGGSTLSLWVLCVLRVGFDTVPGRYTFRDPPGSPLHVLPEVKRLQCFFFARRSAGRHLRKVYHAPISAWDRGLMPGLNTPFRWVLRSSKVPGPACPSPHELPLYTDLSREEPSWHIKLFFVKKIMWFRIAWPEVWRCCTWKIC